MPGGNTSREKNLELGR